MFACPPQDIMAEAGCLMCLNSVQAESVLLKQLCDWSENQYPSGEAGILGEGGEFIMGEGGEQILGET